MLSSKPRYSGVLINSVSESALEVSQYLQETFRSLLCILLLILLLGCGVEGGQENCSLFIWIIFPVLFFTTEGEIKDVCFVCILECGH